MKSCKLCGDKTNSIVNIEFKAVPLCERCSVAVFIQQATWYAQNHKNIIDALLNRNRH